MRQRDDIVRWRGLVARRRSRRAAGAVCRVLVGLRLDDALALVRASGFEARESSPRMGPHMVTYDFRSTRITVFGDEHDTVVKATWG